VPQRISLVEATMASAAIPVLFTPVRLAGEHYVDGGVMVQLPIEAVFQSNPDVVVAINTGKLTLERKEGYATASVVSVAERSVLELLMFEAQARQIELAQRTGRPIFLIAPRLDVYSTLDQDPGLLSINMDYGYMCAADVVGDMDWAATVPTRSDFLTDFAQFDPPVITGRTEPLDPVLAALADAIARTRIRCWALEWEVAGELSPAAMFGNPPRIARSPSAEALDRLRELKTLVRILTLTRIQLGGAVPPKRRGLVLQL
jgi:Patatin-like phospholipase